MSDIALDTLNAKGKELHASKMILATYSPYYEAMFCGAEWTEKTAKSLVIDEDYNVVLEALRIIYSISTIDQTPHPPAMLGELYRFSDKYDFPMIREMCKQELETQVTCESLLVTAQLGLHDIKSKLFAKMDPDLIRKFVDSLDDGNEVLFTMNDLRLVEKKLADGASKNYKELKLVSVCDECDGKTLCNRDCVYCNPKASPIAKSFYIISKTMRTYPVATSCYLVSLFASCFYIVLSVRESHRVTAPAFSHSSLPAPASASLRGPSPTTPFLRFLSWWLC